MDKRHIRLVGWAIVWILGCSLWWWGGKPIATASVDQWTIPTEPPVLPNPGFECTVGYYAIQNPIGRDNFVPNGWNYLFLDGTSPDIHSTQMFYSEECDLNDFGWEKLNGVDSFLVRSQDIESLPNPGKPFDVVIYHKLPATYGGAYSLSGWMTSKCGNQNPVDCPGGYFVAKMAGIDPYGGTDPKSGTIEWVEDRDNQGWQNLFTSTTAMTDTITVFARMKSPFQFHGNMGWMDEFSLVRAPLSALKTLPSKIEEIGKVTLEWFGEQSVDVMAIPGGNYELLFDVERRALPNGEWKELVVGATDESTLEFTAPCLNRRYAFRVRARAEQPEDEDGAWPNHRYPGVWSKPQTVLFTAPPSEPLTPTTGLTPTLFLPVTAQFANDGC